MTIGAILLCLLAIFALGMIIKGFVRNPAFMLIAAAIVFGLIYAATHVQGG